MKIRRQIMIILFWSIIPAAFIGPGTVTTCTKAGADFQFDIMWTLTFSTIACIVLQEAAARIAICSKKTLGEAIRDVFDKSRYKAGILLFVVGSIIFGCAAYEAGNIMGSVQGLKMIFPHTPKYWLVIGTCIFASIALTFKSLDVIAKIMGALVLIMSFAFVSTAYFLNPPIMSVLKGSIVPVIPNTSGAGLLILGIIGTTVVPYDLFLGSSLAIEKQTLREMRIGLIFSIILGGIISMIIVIVGSAITEGMTAEAIKNLEFSYELLQNVLVLYIGDWAVLIFGLGMFAAGFSSAITAPLASAMVATTVYKSKNPEKWHTQSLYFRIVAFGVMLVGFVFGISNIKPIPAIIMAQALNGLILPLISVFLIIVVNDKRIIHEKFINSHFTNVLMAIVVAVSIMIGLINFTNAIGKGFNLKFQQNTQFVVVAVISIIITTIIMVKIYRKRSRLAIETKC